MVEAARRRRLAASSARSSAVTGSLEAHAPLLDAIAASPNDVAPWAVYADLLQTEGHPRGELISLMLERERRPSTRLLDAQRRQLGLHATVLLPAGLEHAVVGWRRGFASELRITAPEQLAPAIADRALRFVEAATLVIDTEQWAAWRAALIAAKLPWRRLRVEVTGAELDAAPLLACCPALETLRIAFPPDGGTVTWGAAQCEQLQLLVLVNAGEVESLDDVELPVLAELRLLGASSPSEDLRTSLRWNRLRRVVVTDDVIVEPDETGPIVHSIREPEPADDGDDWDDDRRPPPIPTTTAFVVVGGPLPAGLVEKLATRLSIAHLSARIATIHWQARPLTAIQLFGATDAELLPYGLAIALGNVLDPAPPIVLVEVDDDRAARYLVLGETPVRGMRRQPDDAVRRALDLALGIDPGSAILRDLLDDLAATPIETVVGNGGTYPLVMIDPSTAPLAVPEEEEPYDDGDEDEDDEYGDDYDWDDLAGQYEEPVVVVDDDDDPPPPPPPVAIVVATAAVVDEVIEEPVVLVEDDVLEPPPITDEDALALPPDHAEQWIEFRDHWDDRATDVDDETSELRWPDPEHVQDDHAILDRQIAEPACGVHARALDHCPGCGAFYCAECGGEDWCSSCFGILAGTAPIDPARPTVSPK